MNLALRAALGAGRASLVRQLLAESMFLSLTGGFFGLMMAEAGVRSLVKAFGPLKHSALCQEIALGLARPGLRFYYALGCSAEYCLVHGAGCGPAAQRPGETAPRGRPRRHGKLRPLPGYAVCFLSPRSLWRLYWSSLSGLLVRTFNRLLAVDPGIHAGAGAHI